MLLVLKKLKIYIQSMGKDLAYKKSNFISLIVSITKLLEQWLPKLYICLEM
jgi:hypothetical protein